MRTRLILLATSLGFAVVQLDVSVVNVAIRSIGVSFSGNVGGLQWIVNAYTVAFAALILSAGALADRLGAKRLFIAGFAIFAAASLACGLAPSEPALIGARAVQGVGAAILAPCSLTLLNHTFVNPDERARAIGIWAAGASAALAAGPVVGGALIAVWGWRAIFLVNLPIALTGTWLTSRYAGETTRVQGGRVDLGGQVTAVASLGALAAAIIAGGSYGFADARVLAGLVLAACAGAAFVGIESRVRQPLLPLALFRSPTFRAATLTGLLVNVAFYGLIFVLSLFFQREAGLSALATGLAFLPLTGAILAANLVAGRLSTRVAPRQLVFAGEALMGLACIALAGTHAGTPYSEMVVQLIALGAGIGLLVPPMTGALLGSVERARSGIAAATLNSARQAGSVIGVSLLGSTVAGGDAVRGTRIAFALALAALVLAALATRTLHRPA